MSTIWLNKLQKLTLQDGWEGAVSSDDCTHTGRADEETARVLITMDRHPDGLLLAVLFYPGLRRNEALGLKWGDFDFKTNMVHIQRDVDFISGTTREGELKTKASNRFVPVPAPLREKLVKVRELPERYVFHGRNGELLSASSFSRKWRSLMEDAGCVIVRSADKKVDMRTRIQPLLTPHYFRHTYVTNLYKAGVDAFVAMKVVGHADYQTTANIYTHPEDEMVRKTGVRLDEVFERKDGAGDVVTMGK